MWMAVTVPPDIDSLAVIGGGVMGAGIARVFAQGGVRVTVAEPDPVVRASLRQRVAERLNLELESSWALLDRVRVVESLGESVDGVGMVIEAGPERLTVKQQIFEELSSATGDDVILASNTSAIPIHEIARNVENQARVIGTHFWNPPTIIRLVEVIRSTGSADWALNAATEVLRRVGMSPVRVEVDIPGFVGNRLQHALKREAIALVAAGICSAETIDTVVREGFGARLGIVGPLEQSDLSGTDLTLAIHEVLMPYLDNTPVAHPYLRDMVARGELGAKTGRGFREWPPGTADRRRTEIAAALAALPTTRESVE
jgi:3-hydroxybutyryl-CoA dehydrogenase